MIRMFSILLFLVFSVSISAQDGSFSQYERAKELMSKENYALAIKTLTRVIKRNPEYSDALLLRAEAKYKMTAYKSAKNDVVEYINQQGISEQVLNLLTKCNYKLEHYKAAQKSLLTLSKLSSNDSEQKRDIAELLGNTYEAQGKRVLACQEWNTALIYGSKSAERKVNIKCEDVKIPEPPKQKVEEKPVVVKKENAYDEMNRAKEIEVAKKAQPKKIKVDEEEKTPVVVKKMEKKKPVADDGSVNRIAVDEVLDLEILGGSLGSRSIVKQPNILILSDEDGRVAIDVCVGDAGKVTSAKYNEGKSSLKTRHLISLAIRKSKAFEFSSSMNEEQCGVIIYHIKKS